MRLAIGDVDIDGEAGSGEPAGGDAAATAAGVLQGAAIGRGVAPDEVVVAAGAHLGIAGIAGGVVDDVIALAAIHVLPVPLGYGARLKEVCKAEFLGIDELARAQGDSVGTAGGGVCLRPAGGRHLPYHVTAGGQVVELVAAIGIGLGRGLAGIKD